MKIRFFLCLLVLALAPPSLAQTPCVGQASVVSADTAAFLVQAPPGWILDCKAGKDQGPLTVLYRTGESWGTGAAVMYVSVLTDHQVHPRPDAERIDAEVADWRGRAPDVHVAVLPPLITSRGNGSKAEVRRFQSASEHLFEIAAYVPRSRIMPLLVMTARNPRAFQEALPAFRLLVRSYEPATLKVVR